MPVKTSREYRAVVLPFTLPKSEKRIDTEFYVEGLATTFETPYELFECDGNKYFETISRAALIGADISDVIYQYDHGGKVLARQSNGTLGIEPTEKGLFIYADLSKSRAAQEMYQEIDNGLITKMSWAFTVAEDKYDRQTRTRTISKIKKVYDVSAVSRPANEGTEIYSRAYFDGVIEMEKQEMLRRARLKIKTYLIGG